MPKVLTERQRDQESVESIIKQYAGAMRMTIPTLAKKAGMPYSTIYARLRDPDTFRRNELRSICRVLKIPEEKRGELLK